jgi:hypothetical protein
MMTVLPWAVFSPRVALGAIEKRPVFQAVDTAKGEMGEYLSLEKSNLDRETVRR